jgi:hypothetical protein
VALFGGGSRVDGGGEVASVGVVAMQHGAFPMPPWCATAKWASSRPTPRVINVSAAHNTIRQRRAADHDGTTVRRDESSA